MIDCKYKALHKIRLFIADPSTRINFKFFFFFFVILAQMLLTQPPNQVHLSVV